MADGTSIEWADATLNFIKARRRDTGKVGDHCEHVSAACRFCYAEVNNRLRGTGLPYKPGHLKGVEIFLDEAKLLRPLGWSKPRRIFPLSLTDLFADFVPDWMNDRFLAVAALTPQHTYLPLTKRPARMRVHLNDPGRYAAVLEHARAIANRSMPRQNAAVTRLEADVALGDRARLWPLPNVWPGVSVEDQATADERVPELLFTRAAKHLVSAEPLLGPIDFGMIAADDTGEIDALRGLSFCQGRNEPAHHARIDGIIVGGESGTAAGVREMHPAWARSIRDQCEAAGTAFLFKQWGAWAWAPENLNFEDAIRWVRLRCGKVLVRHHLDGRTAYRIGKKRAGRVLDGRTHDAMPARAA